MEVIIVTRCFVTLNVTVNRLKKSTICHSVMNKQLQLLKKIAVEQTTLECVVIGKTLVHQHCFIPSVILDEWHIQTG